MLKNPLLTIVGLMFASVAISSSAALPPKYLGIKDFKQCLATQETNTYRSWCMPAEKQGSCPSTSWEQLKALTGIDKVPDCPSEPTVATPASSGSHPPKKTSGSSLSSPSRYTDALRRPCRQIKLQDGQIGVYEGRPNGF